MRIASFLMSVCLMIISFSNVYAKSDSKVKHALNAQSENNSSIYTEDKLSIVVTHEHPQFVIKIKSNPTTGYSWYLKDFNNEVILPVKHTFQPETNKKLIGAPGFEYWTFIVKSSGFIVPMQTNLNLVYARPWETTAKSQQLTFQISTR